jgi:hypothetical protein
MFSTILTIGNGVYYIISFSYEYKTYILSAYSIFDTSKFIFYTLDNLGILKLIKKKVTYDPLYMEIKPEPTDVGEFELIDMEF